MKPNSQHLFAQDLGDRTAPGWIDLQMNGYAGAEFNSPDLSAGTVREATRKIAASGTAAYCPTILENSPERMCAMLAAIAKAKKEDSECAARILGIHLEGPFISHEPGAVGAHDPRRVSPPDLALFDRLQDAADGNIRLLTLAAELPGAAEFARALVRRGVTVSLGHQMAHTPEELAALADAGASALTHLGNGLPNLQPRHDNVIFAGLAEDRLSVMFIPDLHHLPAPVLRAYVRTAGVRRCIAVTDTTYVSGLPPGRYFVYGNNAVLEPDGLLHNPEKRCLVGATICMAQGMANLRALPLGLSDRDLLDIGVYNPLRLLRVPPESVPPVPCSGR